LLDKVVDDTVIKVFTTEMCVTSSGQDLENTVLDRKQGDIKCSTTKIIDDDLGFGFAGSVKTVCWS